MFASIDPPSAPQWLEVANITKINADLKWQPPSSDGGSPITNYVVEKRDVRRKAWQTVDTTVKEQKYTVTPLNEGSLYVFRVAAENAVGMGEFCELEDAVLAKDTFSEFSVFEVSIGLPLLIYFFVKPKEPVSLHVNAFHFFSSNSWTSLCTDGGGSHQETCGAEVGTSQ